jgi:murein DD-endopeptidase MepM/ murein hydrolase activator NlpD
LSARSTCLALSALAVACLAGACAGATRGGGAAGDRANCAWRVCVRWIDAASGRTYSVVNDGPVPATVKLEIRALQNLRRPARLPIERVVPARSRATLVVLDVVERGATRAVESAVSIDLGASDTRPDDYLYGMPFGGEEPRPLLQGFNGSDTHMLGMRYALDFTMPEGTPVLAARRGIVVHVQDGFTAGGVDPGLLERANLAVVAHDDGTLASYGHLSPGIRVAVDDEVEEGDLLGYSGATGFAGLPHLHFHVGVRALGDPGRTIRVRLKDAEGREVELQEGRSYEPARASQTAP